MKSPVRLGGAREPQNGPGSEGRTGLLTEWSDWLESLPLFLVTK